MSTYRMSNIGWVVFYLFALMACSPAKEHAHVEGTLIPVDREHSAAKDHLIDSVISIYRADLEKEMAEVLAYSAQIMTRGTPEALLNNFVADLSLNLGHELYRPADARPIDFCLLNYGGLRAPIPKGPVTRANIFELMPFENELVVLTLSAEKTLELFDYLASASVGMPVSGLRMSIRDEEVREVSINGAPFNPERPYKVLTTDYLAGGGDNMTFFLDPLNTEYLGIRLRDAIILHLQRQHGKGEEIKSKLDGRISY